MNLQGRTLSLQTPPLQGADVALLQRELGLLGIIIPVTERRDAIFGTATHEAVIRFQQQPLWQKTGLLAGYAPA